MSILSTNFELMHPMVEHILTIGTQMTQCDARRAISVYRDYLKANYNALTYKGKCVSYKAYVKLAKSEFNHISLEVHGPKNEFGCVDILYIYNDGDKGMRISLTSSWKRSISNNADVRPFYDIFEIPVELFNEIVSYVKYGEEEHK